MNFFVGLHSYSVSNSYGHRLTVSIRKMSLLEHALRRVVLGEGRRGSDRTIREHVGTVGVVMVI